MAQSDGMIRAGAWVLENGHRALLKLTGGRFPKKVGGMEPVELHAKGRKSGDWHSTMLTTPVHDDDKLVLIASYGGSSDHPAWYKNLVANPDVEITVDGERKPFTARTAEGAEREDLWERATATYKGYAGYQRNTDREIPVVVCEPRSG